MRAALIVAGREARSLFRSPFAWLVLAGASFAMAWVFLSFVQDFMRIAPRMNPEASAPGVTALIGSPALLWASLVLVVLTPLLAMRSISEEKRSGTISLLRSAPISASAVVAGKFLALLLFLWTVVAVAVAMPLSLAAGTALDFGRLAAGSLGLALVAAAFGAICLFMSTLTRQPILAALAGYGALILLWVVNLAVASSAGTTALAWIAFEPHVSAFLRGEVNSSDVAYFLILTGLFLGLAVWKLDADRLGG